ncbi:uncharacterized protein BDV17DRAFT_292446 [Aspergillus undulatus]|uniref:uncharacterized protein n=1 Tax=Aspergillus undulatus TaxID=1810928 RepID=UPI003CCD8A27
MTPANFPESHAENFHYSVYNILRPVPEELKGKYDLVHVRLLFAALSKGNVSIGVNNLVELLRPGSWIQWEDFDGDSWGGRVPSPHVREVNELIRGYMEANGMELHVPAAFLAAANSHAELQNISEKVYNTMKHGSKLKDEINSTYIWSCTRLSKLILSASGKPNAEEEIRSEFLPLRRILTIARREARGYIPFDDKVDVVPTAE